MWGHFASLLLHSFTIVDLWYNRGDTLPLFYCTLLLLWISGITVGTFCLSLSIIALFYYCGSLVLPWGHFAYLLLHSFTIVDLWYNHRDILPLYYCTLLLLWISGITVGTFCLSLLLWISGITVTFFTNICIYAFNIWFFKMMYIYSFHSFTYLFKTMNIISSNQNDKIPLHDQIGNNDANIIPLTTL